MFTRIRQIAKTFSDFNNNIICQNERTIIAPKNDTINKLNNQLIDRIHGQVLEILFYVNRNKQVKLISIFDFSG